MQDNTQQVHPGDSLNQTEYPGLRQVHIALSKIPLEPLICTDHNRTRGCYFRDARNNAYIKKNIHEIINYYMAL